MPSTHDALPVEDGEDRDLLELIDLLASDGIEDVSFNTVGLEIDLETVNSGKHSSFAGWPTTAHNHHARVRDLAQPVPQKFAAYTPPPVLSPSKHMTFGAHHVGEESEDYFIHTGDLEPPLPSPSKSPSATISAPIRNDDVWMQSAEDIPSSNPLQDSHARSSRAQATSEFALGHHDIGHTSRRLAFPALSSRTDDTEDPFDRKTLTALAPLETPGRHNHVVRLQATSYPEGSRYPDRTDGEKAQPVLASTNHGSGSKHAQAFSSDQDMARVENRHSPCLANTIASTAISVSIEPPASLLFNPRPFPPISL